MNKKKHFYLINKNMNGGYGYNTKYWNEHGLFKKYNNDNLNCLILKNDYNSDNTQFNKYSSILKELLNYKNYVINIQFISNFFRYIYYDINNDYSLQKNGDNFVWSNPNITNFKITKTIIQPHGNTSILFLENNDKKDKKVLKIFNNISISDNKYNDNNLVCIKDYLSLEITRIGDKFSFQNNNFFITQDQFKYINFNKQKHFIKDQNDKDIILSCKNNDAINDYIINLILQQIEQDDQLNNFKYVKYHNLFVTKVDDKYRYCIIMDSMDGSIDGYINDKFKDYKANINNDKTKYTNTMKDILEQAEKNLNYIKDQKYLFTHTDMKIENLFYKNKNIGTNKDPKQKLEVYLADFDKSSISYHNIRFYNDITKTDNKIKQSLNNRGFIFNYIKNDSYTIDNINADKDNIKQKHYRLSRIAVNLQNDLNTKIEFEQLYMRYNFTPYYISFDMCSLILSLFYYDKKGLIKLEELKILEKYIFNDINVIYNFYKNSLSLEDKKGNFGELLNIILNSSNENDYFIYNKLDNEYVHINKLYITNNRNKLCISYPLFKDNKSNHHVTDNIYITKFNSIPQEYINNYNIQNVYDIYTSNNEYSNNINFDTKYIIEYNDDNYNINYLGATTFKEYYVKTNRYSYTSNLNISRINEFDNITIDEIEKIVDIFQKNNNFNKYEIKYDNNKNYDFEIIEKKNDDLKIINKKNDDFEIIDNQIKIIDNNIEIKIDTIDDFISLLNEFIKKYNINNDNIDKYIDKEYINIRNILCEYYKSNKIEIDNLFIINK